MSYEFQEHEGLVSVVVDGALPKPFMYIDTNGAPPYRVEPLHGETQEFDTYEAAQAALIFALEHRGQT
jgi:hypothetical protein